MNAHHHHHERRLSECEWKSNIQGLTIGESMWEKTNIDSEPVVCLLSRCTQSQTTSEKILKTRHIGLCPKSRNISRIIAASLPNGRCWSGRGCFSAWFDILKETDATSVGWWSWVVNRNPNIYMCFIANAEHTHTHNMNTNIHGPCGMRENRDQQFFSFSFFFYPCIPLRLCFYFIYSLSVGSYTWWISNFSINRLVKHETNVAGAEADVGNVQRNVVSWRREDVEKRNRLHPKVIVRIVRHRISLNKSMLYRYSSAIFLRRKDFNLFYFEMEQTAATASDT